MRHTNRKNAAIGLIALAISLVFLASIPFKVPAQRAPFGVDSRFFPEVAGLLLVTCSALLLGRELFRRSEPDAREVPAGIGLYNLRQLAPKLMLVVAYVAAIEPVGYLTSTIGVLAALLIASGTRSWLVVGSVALIVPIGIYFFFQTVMDIHLPAGVLL